MSKNIRFEESIGELEEIVRQLEKGELPLEESLKQFEKGIGLARRCQAVLEQAEQKIHLLTADQTTTQPNADDASD